MGNLNRCIDCEHMTWGGKCRAWGKQELWIDPVRGGPVDYLSCSYVRRIELRYEPCPRFKDSDLSPILMWLKGVTCG